MDVEVEEEEVEEGQEAGGEQLGPVGVVEDVGGVQPEGGGGPVVGWG